MAQIRVVQLILDVAFLEGKMDDLSDYHDVVEINVIQNIVLDVLEKSRDI